MKIIFPAATLLTVATLLSGIGEARASQDDGLRETAVVAVQDAGSAAGLARACGVDPRPIAAAAEQLFHRLQFDRAARATALAGYRANEARATAIALAGREAALCSNERLLRETVEALNAIAMRQSAARPEAASSRRPA